MDKQEYDMLYTFICQLEDFKKLGLDEALYDENGRCYISEDFDFEKFHRYWDTAYRLADHNRGAKQALDHLCVGKNLPKELEAFMESKL